MNLLTLAQLGWMAALASTGGASPPPGNLVDKESPASRCIAAQARALDFSGVVSLVQRQGATRYARGTVSGAGSSPISAGVRFNLASAGKMFTAVAVAQLVDAGKVRLDEPVGRYVEGLTPEAARVTVRQLLNHTSGLGSFFSPDNLGAIRKARTTADLLPLVASDKPSFAPGSRFQYSNTGFLLLGLVIERVSGESYGDYLRSHIFGPAGMTSSGVEPDSGGVQAVGMTRMPAHAPPGLGSRSHGPPHLGMGMGHGPMGPLRPAPEATLPGNPAGGSYSTAPDMERFFAALLGHTLTTAAMLAALTTGQATVPSTNGEGPPLQYGLGFGVGNASGHRWFGHNGGAPGVNTEASAYPDDGTILIVMSNRDPPSATTLYRRIQAKIFDDTALKACAEGR